jgi:threonine dehydrogenase-like Zn-dependent dehydrogenase
MLAAFHVSPDRLALRDVPVPSLSEGEALIRVRACAFCGSDRHDLADTPAEPRVPGHEFAGTVEHVPTGTPFAPGDPVVVDPIMRCGQCDYCCEGRDHLCRSMAVIGCQTPGGFAEFVKAPAGNLRRMPDGLPFEVATLADPLAVALHAVDLVSPVEGQRCVIYGAGTIGLLVAQVLRLRGAANVALVDIEPGHLDLAGGLGPFETVHVGADEPAGLPRECHLAVELAGGAGPTLGQAIASTRKGGTVLCVAQRPPTELPYPSVLFGELRLQGTFGQTSRNFAEAIDLLGSGRIAGAPLVTDRFPLTQAQAALERFLEPASVKVVVQPAIP